MASTHPVPPHRTVPNVLSIAGTDPTGGAGIQADLKSFAAHRTYGMAVVTALVAQNTQGVREIHLPPVSFLRAQLDAVSDDVALDAVKIGMLGTAEVIGTVAEWWDQLDSRPALVVDPVMVATSGDRLLDAEAESALLEFLHRADLVTPNVPELAILAGADPADDKDLLEQARQAADALDTIVLAKGGHLSHEIVEDLLVYPAPVGGPEAASGTDAERPTEKVFSGPRVATKNTHGTGCSVSAAMAALRARGLSWETAAGEVKEWMTQALRASETLDVGQGHGPIQHFPEGYSS